MAHAVAANDTKIPISSLPLDQRSLLAVRSDRRTSRRPKNDHHLDGKTFEPSLIHTPFTRRAVMNVKTLGMSECDSLQNVAHPSILGRLEHKTPVVWHQ